MFARITLIILTLSTTCFILLWGAVAYGREFARPEDVRADSITACDELPCVLGLIPGRTLWHEAQTHLARWDAAVSLKTIQVTVNPRAEASFYQSVNGVALGRIALRFDQPLSVGWLVSHYGQPCGITIYHTTRTATLRYAFLLANIRLDHDQVGAHTPILSIHFTDPAFKSTQQPNLCVDNITNGAQNYHWKGFAPLWFYIGQNT